MPAIAFTADGLLNFKRVVREMFPDEKSTHLTEAVASACGFDSHAAALAALKSADTSDPEYILLNDAAFARRLCQVGGTTFDAEEYNFEGDWLDVQGKNLPPLVINTHSIGFYEEPYTSRRNQAWRNTMVAGINAGIERKLFSIIADDNRWPEAAIRLNNGWKKGHIYRFVVADIPAIASVRDIGFSELSFHVALWPTARAETFIGASNGRFHVGEVAAEGWLERKDGAWLMPSTTLFSCRSDVLAKVSGLHLAPKGYADRGSRR